MMTLSTPARIGKDGSLKRKRKYAVALKPHSSIYYSNQILMKASSFLPKVEYAYNPLPGLPHTLEGSSHGTPCKEPPFRKHTSTNSVNLDPHSIGLPYRSTLDHVRASRYWKANQGETVKFLRLLADDGCSSDIEVKRGITLSKLAKTALRPGCENQTVLATHYVFPDASEVRIRHIAALTVMYFVFDDKAEETTDDQLRVFRNDFFDRLRSNHDHEPPINSLQSYINSIIRGINAEDSIAGGGGREMVECLQNAFGCIHSPKDGLQSVAEYLNFRRQNVGADSVVAAIKYSIKSSLSVPPSSCDFSSSSSSTTQHRLTPFLNFFANHLSVTNDLFSYDKEIRALNRGQASQMINLVHVIKTLTGLQSTDDAKAVAFALQLQIEREMREEVEKLLVDQSRDCDDGGKREEAKFLNAVMQAAAGHVMFCMTTGRYGGEAARIAS